MWFLNNFSLVYGPPNPWRESQVQTLGTPRPPYGLLLVRTAVFTGCLVAPEKISKFDFFRNPSAAPGMCLGDHLVTIRVLEHPWGPT